MDYSVLIVCFSPKGKLCAVGKENAVDTMLVLNLAELAASSYTHKISYSYGTAMVAYMLNHCMSNAICVLYKI